MPSILLAFDPGDTTGWASFNFDSGEPLTEGAFYHDEATEWFTEKVVLLPMVKTIVIEDFRLMAGKALQQTGSTFIACQIIGMLKLWAYPDRIPVFLQPPSIKPIAERLTGRKPKGAHKFSHSVDAYNHGAFYLNRQGRFKTELMKEIENERAAKQLKS